jgi:FkbM family methyltransferase
MNEFTLMFDTPHILQSFRKLGTEAAHAALRQLEFRLGALRGKGSGAFSVRTEVARVASVLEREPILVLDCGGNVGLYSAEILARYPNCEIHIFEPSAPNVAALLERFRLQRKVHVVPVGVSGTPGDGTIFADAPGSGLASLNRRRVEHHGLSFEYEEPVRLITIDQYWVDVLNERQIDLLKLDIEGHELPALEGALNALAQTSLVQIELGGCNIDSKTYLRDFFYFFKENGFSLNRITRFGLEELSRYSEVEESFATSNYLARRLA